LEFQQGRKKEEDPFTSDGETIVIRPATGSRHRCMEPWLALTGIKFLLRSNPLTLRFDEWLVFITATPA